MKISLKKVFQYGFVLYLLAVLYLCFGKFENTPDVPWSLLGIPSDKLVHFGMFFPFPILAFLAFDRFTDTPKSTFLFSGITWVLGLLSPHFSSDQLPDPSSLSICTQERAQK